MTRQALVSGSKEMYGTSAKIRSKLTKADLNFVEMYEDLVICYPVTLHASKVIHNIFYAKRAYTVTSITWVGDIAQAITGTVVKATGTATPASATTPMHTAAGVVCNTTAHTPLVITPTATAADLVLAAGDRIALVLGAALTTGSGLLVIRMTRS